MIATLPPTDIAVVQSFFVGRGEKGSPATTSVFHHPPLTHSVIWRARRRSHRILQGHDALHGPDRAIPAIVYISYIYVYKFMCVCCLKTDRKRAAILCSGVHILYTLYIIIYYKYKYYHILYYVATHRMYVV
jgi:hypothetical protein